MNEKFQEGDLVVCDSRNEHQPVVMYPTLEETDYDMTRRVVNQTMGVIIDRASLFYRVMTMSGVGWIARHNLFRHDALQENSPRFDP